MTEQIGLGTAQGLTEYLDQLVDKGRATSGGIVPLKSTLKQVLSRVEGEEKWQSLDMREIDVHDYIERFKNLTIGKYSPESYAVYQSRINKIKAWYLSFLKNPGWSPTITKRGKRGAKNLTEGKTELVQVAQMATSISNGSNKVAMDMSTDFISYPFPLRQDRMATLYLPKNLTKAESVRLGKFIDSLSTDDNE